MAASFQTLRQIEEPSDMDTHFGYWHIEDEAGYGETSTLENAVIEVADLAGGDLEELGGWRIKNLATEEIKTGTEVMWEYGELAA